MNTPTVGMKVYSYCYGPMTVKAVDGRYIVVSVDNPKGFAPEFSELCDKTDLNNIKFLISAFGHWYFASPAEVEAKKENNDFPEAQNQAGSARALVRNDSYLHADFGGNTTGLTEKKNKDTGLTEKNRNSTTGLTEKN